MARECKSRDYFTKAVVRNPEKLKAMQIAVDEVVVAGVTDKSALTGCCTGIDVVFSSIGITRQKDGLTYRDVDYQANLNLLQEALRSGVKKFVYVAVLHGDKMRDLKICEAKERFVDALKSSGMDYCIIRPTGYFSDMKEFYEMAVKGRVLLFGTGKHRMNPIHGEDLAKVCVDAMEREDKDIPVGGPEVFTHDQIAETAFCVSGNRKKITHIPASIAKILLAIIRTLTSSRFYGPVEFLVTVLTRDMTAPPYGRHTLKKYFEALKGHGG